MAIIIAGLFVVPLSLFYQRELSRARDRDVLSYWVLIEAQLRLFERKWIASDSNKMETLTGADFSQVTGPSSILERAQGMTLLPFRLKDISFLVVVVLIPFIPVAALAIPMDKILHTLLRIVA